MFIINNPRISNPSETEPLLVKSKYTEFMKYIMKRIILNMLNMIDKVRLSYFFLYLARSIMTRYITAKASKNKYTNKYFGIAYMQKSNIAAAMTINIISILFIISPN